jgi:hypothetical protein
MSSHHMERDDQYAIYQITVASGEGFECLMECAENTYNREYACYSDFEDDFNLNLPEWQPDFVDFAWKSFSRNIEKRFGTPILRNLAHKGAFFEQVDYVFVFVFSIIGDREHLQRIVHGLKSFRDLDGDDFSLAIDDIEKYFSPSYSGKDRSHIWDLIAVEGIEWPPRIHRVTAL